MVAELIAALGVLELGDAVGVVSPEPGPLVGDGRFNIDGLLELLSREGRKEKRKGRRWGGVSLWPCFGGKLYPCNRLFSGGVDVFSWL